MISQIIQVFISKVSIIIQAELNLLVMIIFSFFIQFYFFIIILIMNHFFHLLLNLIYLFSMINLHIIKLHNQRVK